MKKLKLFIFLIISLWVLGFWYILIAQISHNDEALIQKLENSEKKIKDLELKNKNNEIVIEKLKISENKLHDLDLKNKRNELLIESFK
jgi:hypothetical protein